MTASDKPVTVEAAISEVERELQVRARCYDNWVRDGKMSRIDAQDRLDRLAAAHTLIEKVMAKSGPDHIIKKDADLPF